MTKCQTQKYSDFYVMILVIIIHQNQRSKIDKISGRLQAIKFQGGQIKIAVLPRWQINDPQSWILQSNPVFWNRFIIFGALPWPNR